MPRPARPMKMECPRDRAPLVEREHEIPGFNVFADHCPQCEGIFLDKGELLRLTGKKNINDLITTYLGVDAGSRLLCPGCGGLMDDEHFADESGAITIDVCLSCKGVWLDPTELDAMATLDDAAFRGISTAKRAEVFDQDRADARRRRKMDPLVRSLLDIQRTLERMRRLGR